MNEKALLDRISQIASMGELALKTRRGERIQQLERGPMRGFRVAGLSFIANVFGRNHSHYLEFDASTTSNFPSDAEQGLAILEVIRGEIEGGWVRSFSSLVAADLFGDFLEMAEYLVKEGYKDAAAVMAGSVLEEHLRRLCPTRQVDTHEDKQGDLVPKKADRINAELTKAGAYNGTEQKMVTAWLGLRNDAAHGHYDKYTQDQVANMVQGIMGFISKIHE